VTVTDIDPTFVADVAASGLGSHSRATVREMDATAIDAPDGYYDLAVFALSLHHLPPEMAARAFAEGTRAANKLLIIDLRRPPAPLHLVVLAAVLPFTGLVPLTHDGFISSLRADSPSALRALAHYADPAITAQTTATDTREVIVESAFACFRRRGLNKTTIVDIARAANVSRSTVYEYFRDKASVVEACAEHSSQKFYREMAKAMDKGDSLEEKLTLAAVFVTRARRIAEPEKYFDADEVSLLLTKNAAVLLRECGEFLAPYLAAAKLTGEVRKDLDVAAAGEWFARMLFSLFSTPSSTLNMDDDDVVGDFVRSHAVRGFASNRAGRSR
jgi:AcrR family transcriptional regulator